MQSANIISGFLAWLAINVGIIAYTEKWNGTARASNEKAAPVRLSCGLPGRSQDCGVNCLYLLCELTGKNATMSQLRELSHTSDNGTTMLDLQSAALELGFRIEPVEISFAALRDHVSGRHHFAILFCNGNHFALAVGTHSGYVRILDPSFGINDADEKTLGSGRLRWSHKALLVTADD